MALTLARLMGAIGTTDAIRADVGLTGLTALVYVVSTFRSLLGQAERDETPLKVPGLSSLLALAGRLAHRNRSSRSQARAEGTAAFVAAEQLVRFSESSAMDFHSKLRPRLSAVAMSRLTARGIDLSDRDEVSAVLGPVGADLVDPSRAAPADRDLPGVPASVVRDLLFRLDDLT
ncbi:MAG: hypothetical protein ACYDC0_12370 [Acidimicrobiales bacterium]